jgi:hypothetical protein
MRNCMSTWPRLPFGAIYLVKLRWLVRTVFHGECALFASCQQTASRPK